MFTAHYQL